MAYTIKINGKPIPFSKNVYHAEEAHSIIVKTSVIEYKKLKDSKVKSIKYLINASSNTIIIACDSNNKECGKIERLSIESIRIIHGLKLKIINCNIEGLFIRNPVENLEISNESKIKKFGFEKFKPNNTFHIKNIKITDSTLSFTDNFAFIDMKNKDKVKIENISLESGAKIYNYPVGVKDYPANSLMVTKNSHIYPWKYNEEKGSKKKEDREKEDGEKINFDSGFCNDIKQPFKEHPYLESKLLDLRRLYQMLKRQANDRQDYIQAWFFYSRELKAHQWVLSKEKEAKDKPHIRNDKTILWFNLITNNFGLSWELPFRWLFGINVFFTLLLFSIFWGKGLSPLTFFQLFDIVGGVQGVVGEEFRECNSIKFLSFIHRVISAYLYYSAIIAFRRFSRKP